MLSLLTLLMLCVQCQIRTAQQPLALVGTSVVLGPRLGAPRSA